ncbi:DUF1389 domain-containing protein [Chlamydia pneumoniae]|nr:DUF1389 domain-containing protein [Chlamydia pneumoniae]
MRHSGCTMKCSPLTLVPHIFLKNDCECHRSCSLKIRTIARLILGLVLALVSALSFVFLAAPISYAIGGTLALAAIVILIITLVVALLAKSKVLPIPNELQKIIYNRYPKEVFYFVKTHSLTVNELKIFINCWKSGTDLPPNLHKKAEAFGIDILKSIDLTLFPEFEEILLQNCPLYWLSHFIDKTESVAGEIGLNKTQKVYGLLGPLAFHKGYTTIFHSYTRPLLTLISESQYKFLYSKASKNQWDSPSVKKTCEEIFKELPHNMIFRKDVQGISQFLFLFFSHGITWEQAQMIQLINPDNWKMLCQFDKAGGHCSMATFGGFLNTETNMFDPVSSNYEPTVNFMTWKELKVLLEKVKESPMHPASALVQKICVNTTHHQNLLKRWQFVRNTSSQWTSSLPQYAFHAQTYKLEKKIESSLPIRSSL